MRNYKTIDTAIINASEETPTALKLYFDTDLRLSEVNSIDRVVNYWLSSTPITGSDLQADIEWENNFRVLTVKANFDEGAFCGNLLHHEAIGLGDEKFSIGLVRLLYEGYTARTRRGKDIPPAEVQPICIEFVYEEVVEAEEMNVNIPLLDAILSGIRLDTIYTENRMLRSSIKRLRDTLMSVIEEMSEYV